MKYHLKPQSFVIPLSVGGIAGIITNSIPIGLAVFAALLMPAFIGLYIPYAKDNPEHFWFKRKLYGWGWTPVTWQGWLITFAYVALIVLFALTIDDDSPTREILFTFVLPLVLLTTAFIRIAYRKGERPKWQWGRDDEDNSPQ